MVTLAACLLVGACGGGGSGSGASSTASDSSTASSTQQTSTGGAPTSTPPTSSTTSVVLFLVGHQEATAAAIRLLTGFETRVNATPGPDDVVLFAVTAVDGPMPQTREQIEALRGKSYGPSAILLVKTDQNPDLELRALVVQETRDLLQQNQQPRAADLPVIIAEDPNLALLLRGLAAQR